MTLALPAMELESVKKWLSERNKKNGLYVHYSTPRVVGGFSDAQIRALARGGDWARLERAVLAGQGRRLLAERGLPLSRQLPELLAKCEALHAAVERGSLRELQGLLDSKTNKRKFAACRDEAGVGLLHKAIYYDYMDIAEWLVRNYPQLVHQRDSQGRTPLHYAAVCRDEAAMAALLEGAGALRGARDAAGRTPAYYRALGRSELVLPTPVTPDMAKETKGNPKGLVIKRHNIRIWCHDCDMAKLQRVVWEGHGTRLLSEVSSQPIVKRFLEAVPYIMNTIREIHNCVIQNDLEGLIKHAGDPVPPQALSSRDPHNMTVLHKAAGLGHGAIMKYIAYRYPEGINDVDNDGRTALHYAAAVKDEQHTYETLVDLGADESVLDNKNKTPVYYIQRPQDIDKNILKILPEARRTPSSAYPPSWDWQLLDTEVITELNKKPRRRFKHSNENISSNTHTMSDSTQDTRRGMKQSSTYEYIQRLPGLDATRRSNEHLSRSSKEPGSADDKSGNDVEPSSKVNTVEINEEESNKLIESEQEHDHNNTEEETASKTPGDKIEDSEKVHNDTPEENKIDSGITKVPESTAPIENIEESGEKDETVTGDLTSINNETQSTDTNNVDEEEDINQITNKEEERKQSIKSNEQENHIEKEEKDTSKEENQEVIENKESTPEHRSSSTEGNNNTVNNEDDEDVQVQGETQSEYSDFNLRSTAEASNTGSSKRGNFGSGRNTQESLIEGIVNGETEMDSQDASMAQLDGSVEGDVLVVGNDIDPEVTEMINSSNMEMLAALVLNGEGSRLVGRRSGNYEVQAFLDNVPSYMKKIRSVHLAARDGNIRDLQAALDRRKFAIARDPVSPNGATPLHVAVVFGMTNIIKYLGGRFPETLSAVDFEGRTALHYAAVLSDNGHYYNLLQQLGANAKDLDDNGRTAVQYKRNPSLLPFNRLASDFGISEEVMQKMLSDRIPDDQVSSRRVLDEPEALDTLERCYRLLDSAKTSRTPLSASSNKATPPLVLGRFLKRTIFDTIKTRVTKLDHNLFDVIWPAVKKLPDNRNILQTVEEDYPGGVAAPDYYVYAVFSEFLTPLIKDIHNINIHSDLTIHPKSVFADKPENESSTSLEPLVELNIDPSDDFVLSGTMECMRNLVGFELPLNLSIGQLEEIEGILTTVLLQEDFAKFNEQSSNSDSETDHKGGTYYTLIEVLEKPSEICATLASAGLLVALCDTEEIDDAIRLHGRHWPHGRGVYVSDDKTVAVWINVHDHLRVLTCTPADTPGEIGLPFSRLTYIMCYLHQNLDFVWDPYLGYLSNRPNFLGAGIRFSLVVNFVGLSKDQDNLKHLCAMRGLQYRETLSPDISRISNYQCLGIIETNCFNDFSTAASNLLHLEKDLTLSSNTTHIANMLTNIFKRKRSSLADLESPEKK